jgi:4-hydroxybenzoate polyprenyltransferase
LTPSLSTAVLATIRPLLQRIRLGEGGLIGMATWAAAWQTGDPLATVSVALLVTALLAAVYLFNDVLDRGIDAHNPKKIDQHREPLMRAPRLFLSISLALHLAVIIAAGCWRDGWAAACAASLLLLNPIYSLVAKRIPLVDVMIVGVMGGAVIGLATSDPSLILISSAMTAISHAFQTRVDETSDRSTGVRSSGTAPTHIRHAIWVFLLICYASAVAMRLGMIWAITAMVPYGLLISDRGATRSWAWARVYFAILWIAATV